LEKYFYLPLLLPRRRIRRRSIRIIQRRRRRIYLVIVMMMIQSRQSFCRSRRSTAGTTPSSRFPRAFAMMIFFRIVVVVPGRGVRDVSELLLHHDA